MKTVSRVGDRIETEEGEVEVVLSQGNCFSKDSKQCFFLRKKEGFSGLFCCAQQLKPDRLGPCYPNPSRCSSICYLKVEK